MKGQRKAPSSEVTILAEGVDSFPENKEVITKIKEREPVTAKELLDNHHPRYHGFDKPGCILVKVRKEMIGREPNQHYLDIYGCLTCGLHRECLHSGWEIGWYGGKHVSNLSTTVEPIPVCVWCEGCKLFEMTTADSLNKAIKTVYEAHSDKARCKEQEEDKFYTNLSWEFLDRMV